MKNYSGTFFFPSRTHQQQTMRDGRRCGIQTVKHESHCMRCELFLTELMLLLHIQQMIDEVIALLMPGTSQPKGLTHQLTKELIV